MLKLMLELSRISRAKTSFEAPEAGDPDWTINTDNQTKDESLNQLLEKVLPLIKVSVS